MITVLISIALPVILWALTMGFIPSGMMFEMDWGLSHPGSFSYLHSYYYRIFSIIFWVGMLMSLGVAFVIHGEPAGMLALSAVYAFVFNAWLTYCYEGYLHSKYPKNVPRQVPEGVGYVGPSNYTPVKYALTLSLAFSSLSLFLTGFIAAIIVLVSR